MSHISKDMRHIMDTATCILLDIEGTTSSIDFVRKDLHKYLIQNIQNYIVNHWNDVEVQKVVKELIFMNNEEKQTALHDENSDVKCKDVSKIQEDTINKLKNEIQSDQKSAAVKELQGLVWMDGFTKGELVGHLYPDVVDAFKIWKSQVKDIYIYSNGSVQSQCMLFGRSVYGDLRKYIAGNFDTKVGSKLDAESYSKICQTIGKSPNEVVFFSDRPKELFAAKEAGLQIVLVIRNPECPMFTEEMCLLKNTDPTINSFLEVVNNAEEEEK
nr:enolase-phosphatase E1 isoform X1 [Parasteatoda tepidariorum]XP_015927691.1 enolase-phosphatase E1 isoform X1 [Parasteatoda tepidariorum]